MSRQVDLNHGWEACSQTSEESPLTFIIFLRKLVRIILANLNYSWVEKTKPNPNPNIENDCLSSHLDFGLG